MEGSILQAVLSTSSSLQDDIKSLEAQLRDISLDSAEAVVSQFTTSHRDLLAHLSNRLDSIFTLHTNLRTVSSESQTAEAYQRILDSLHFPQIRERRSHVSKAHEGTYRWMLEPRLEGTRRWDDFVAWLRAPSGKARIYWVHGKIGAGKTTLLRFIDDNLSPNKHMVPWAENKTIFRASYFFWSAGNNLQKSTSGLLRTLLTQLFEKTLDLIPRSVQPSKWRAACLTGSHVLDWTDSELEDCLRECILYAARSGKVFLLIDGLDEYEGTNESREHLIEILSALATYENVKMCLSSRPWNIFRDAFGSCPQLKLENLTQYDIIKFVQGQLYGDKLFNNLVHYDHAAAEALVESIISKAAGVFLWVRLVVKQVLNGLRDGDGIETLGRKVQQIPADLDEYFMRLIESIEPQNRREASILFQLALFREDQFRSLHPHYLLDFSFVEESTPNFALDPSYQFTRLNLADRGALSFRLESTSRKLNSRCKGLLECYVQNEEQIDIEELVFKQDLGFTSADEKDFHLGATDSLALSTAYAMQCLTVDFLHRSLRDFLLTPRIQSLLHHHTQGPYDTRGFFRSARLVQLIALGKTEEYIPISIGLVSYVLSTLTVPVYRDTPDAAAFATMIRPVVENLIRFPRAQQADVWYISHVFECWDDEESTFLSLAIDFGLNSYVRLHLTSQSIQKKQGRPILDYILRPRFEVWSDDVCVGRKLPDLAFLEIVFKLGANPNQKFHGVSAWALFICFVADVLADRKSSILRVDRAVYVKALEIMIQNGADSFLPALWLSSPAHYQTWTGGDGFPDENAERRFGRRFPNVTPKTQENLGNGTFVAVSDLLECFRNRLGDLLDTSKSLALHREVQGQASVPYNPVSTSSAQGMQLH